MTWRKIALPAAVLVGVAALGIGVALDWPRVRPAPLNAAEADKPKAPDDKDRDADRAAVRDGAKELVQRFEKGDGKALAGRGSFTTGNGTTIDYGAAGRVAMGPGGATAGRGVGGVQVTAPGGQTFTNVGAAHGAVGPNGNAVGGKAALAVGQGSNGSAVSANRGGIAIGPHAAVAGATRGVVGMGADGLSGADQGGRARVSDKEEWIPLGAFGMAKGEDMDPNQIFQLAIDKDGVLRGNYYDALSDTTLPVQGAVDRRTQRAAWTVGDRKETVYETGVGNLTEPETTMLVHFGKDRTQQWTLVRLEEPQEQK